MAMGVRIVYGLLFITISCTSILLLDLMLRPLFYFTA
ncbi:uncharacterized protein G2W53_043315 [Senna tora]|uniref:Uncharacterized protein n=1 Tax=Senna tora TaxID=362788 RepID=A0A834SII9_9FABA|nr:uncharacterized protein G2W53_043315 [Senna tora]